MEWFLKVVKEHYADFKGRARRKEFWMFFLFSILINIGLSVLDGIIFGTNVISSIFYLATLVPYIAVGVRRMHDVGKSGWFLLIPIYSLILACTDSEPGENEWGANPKGIGNSGEIDKIGQE